MAYINIILRYAKSYKSGLKKKRSECVYMQFSLTPNYIPFVKITEREQESANDDCHKCLILQHFKPRSFAFVTTKKKIFSNTDLSQRTSLCVHIVT